MLRKLIVLFFLLPITLTAHAMNSLTVNNSTPTKIYSDGFLPSNCYPFSSFKTEVVYLKKNQISFYLTSDCSGSAIGIINLSEQRILFAKKDYIFYLKDFYLAIKTGR